MYLTVQQALDVVRQVNARFTVTWLAVALLAAFLWVLDARARTSESILEQRIEFLCDNDPECVEMRDAASTEAVAR